MKFKVGDKVRVKEWKDVLKECGIDKDHSSGAVYIIAKAVADVCGLVFTVTECDETMRYYSISGLNRFGEKTELQLIEELLEPVCDAKIVITTDGKETLARLYEDGKVRKSAKAECSPDDKFDFAVGAKIAFERLIKTAPAKIIIGKKYRVIGCSPSPRHCFKFGEIITPLTVNSGYFYGTAKSGIRQWINNEDVELVEEPAEPKYYSGKVVCVDKYSDCAYTIGKIYEFKDGRVKTDNGEEAPISIRVTSLDEWNGYDWTMAEFIEIKE